MNICKNCKHVVRKEDDTNIWSYLCGKAERLAGVDPVTGEHGYHGKNDLGGSYITQDKFEYCKKVNPTGECQMYEAAHEISKR